MHTNQAHTYTEVHKGAQTQSNKNMLDAEQSAHKYNIPASNWISESLIVCENKTMEIRDNRTYLVITMTSLALHTIASPSTHQSP